MTGAAHAADVEVEEGVAPQPGILRRFLQGDLASLRVLLGLAVIWAIFQSQNDRFLSATNLTNLMLQITAVGLISVGIVYVLLLGEIDLSVGAVSGLSAAVMAVLNVKHGWDPYLAIAVGVATGMAIGLLQGAIFTRFGVPSFVVTLAGLLAWQGALLYVLGETGHRQRHRRQDHRPGQHVLLGQRRLDLRDRGDRDLRRRHLLGLSGAGQGGAGRPGGRAAGRPGRGGGHCRGRGDLDPQRRSRRSRWRC